jgi:diketogulonate reductase-like aldo/keto reductase
MWYIVGLSAIVSKCLEVGINFFDTAEVSYLNQGIEIYKSYIGCY